MRIRHTCPKCSLDELRYQPFGSSSIYVCRMCGWVLWHGHPWETIKDITSLDVRLLDMRLHFVQHPSIFSKPFERSAHAH